MLRSNVFYNRRHNEMDSETQAFAHKVRQELGKLGFKMDSEERIKKEFGAKIRYELVQRGVVLFHPHMVQHEFQQSSNSRKGCVVCPYRKDHWIHQVSGTN